MRQLKYIHSYLHRPVLVVSSASHGRVAGHIVGYYPWPHVVEYEQFAVLAIQLKTLCRSKAEPNMRKKRGAPKFCSRRVSASHFRTLGDLTS